MSLESFDQAIQTSLENISEANLEEALKELKQLRLEKETLEGKIRGYMTLSDIYHEHREEYKKLKTEYEKLLQKVNKKESSAAARENMDVKACNDPNTSDTARNRTATPEQRTDPNMETSAPSLTETQRSGNILTDVQTERGHADTRSKAITKNGAVSQPQSFVRETIPMQESMVEETPGSITYHSDTEGSQKKNSSPSPLTLRQSSGTSKSGDDLIQFSGSLHVQASQYSPENSGHRSHYLQSMDLSDLEKNLESENTSDTLAAYVKKTFKRLEQKCFRLEQGNTVLIEENKALLSQKKHLENETKDLRIQIQSLEREKYELTATEQASTQDEGWVKVEKQSESNQSESPETAKKPEPTVEALQKKISQLKDANQRWVQEWDKLRSHVQSQVDVLQAERDQLTRQLTNLKIEDEKRQRDNEKMLQNLKKKCQDEEAAKEDALLQLAQAGHRADSLQEKLTTAEDRLNNLSRQKQTLDMELSVRQRQVSTEHGTVPVTTSPNSTASKTLQDLRTENEVLRQQLLVFQEDFDRERQDRASAQSVKDDLKKQNDTLKKRTRSLEQKISSMEKQNKNAEDALHNAIGDKEKLQQELCEVKNQLRREQEANKIPPYRAPPTYLPPQPPIMHPGVPQQPYMTPMYQPQGYMRHPPQHQMVPQYVAPASQAQRMAEPGYHYYQTNQIQSPIETLPGAWNCNSCTYTNYPGRTVCEMCGYVQQHGQTNRTSAYGSNGGMLRPRGDEGAAGGYQPHNRGVGP